MVEWRRGRYGSVSHSSSRAPVRPCSNGNRWDSRTLQSNPPYAVEQGGECRSPQPEAGLNQLLHCEQEKSGKHIFPRMTPSVLACMCPQSVSCSSPERCWSSPRRSGCYLGGVGASLRSGRLAAMKNTYWADIRIVFLGFIPLQSTWLLSWLRSPIVWIYKQLGKCLGKPSITSLMTDTIWGSRCTTRKHSSMGSTSKQRWIFPTPSKWK